MFREPSLEDAFPDPDARAEASVKVLETAFRKLPIVKSDPPRSPAYFKAHSGQEAISKAIPVVIRQDWSDDPDEPPPPTENEIEEHLALELDPALVAMYENTYGPNWQETRARLMRGG